ncbi:MAG: Fe-S cluster assembly protein SufD [Dysgonamonadaceae bacterium]|jgi:Fe-S cluster assembly protein SufD|nr:Fe-S cluster assembly protein SufD [Dysgonamonadaceae bacterium]
MQQYIDFFNSQREKIDNSCELLLNSFRQKAFESFKQKGFPAYNSENYRHTDIDSLLKDDFGFYLNRPQVGSSQIKTFCCNVPNLNSYQHFTFNGYYIEESYPDLPPNVFSGSLNVFARQYPDLFLKYYNRQAGEKGDGLTDFNTSFVQDGYVLYVPKNTVIEKVIQLTNISGGKHNSLVNRRIMVVMEEGAHARLLVCDHTNEEKSILVASQVTEIYVNENASLDLCELEESSLNTVRLTNCFVQQAEASTVTINTITLSNGFTRNNYLIDLAGKRSETNLYGMAIADVQQKIDNFTVINHLTSYCRSNELFKYILDDEATGVFSGKIIVSPNAQKTEAFQSNRNLLGNRNCRMYSKPQLEIYADDVTCSHGMTTGQLDEAALFYMRSRGISEREAILLLKSAFTGDILQKIQIEGLRDRLKLLVEKRLRGELMKCKGCV